MPELSYFTCVILMARPFISPHDLDPLTFEFDLFSKTLNLLIIFDW
jgi:hypothetical protein